MKTSSLKRGIILEVLISLLTVGLLFNCSLLLVSRVSNVRFSGAVYAATGVPVINAIVSASGANGSGVATTGSSGAYTINTGLKTGTYNVKVIATGYLIQNTSGVQVTAGQNTPGVNFYLNLSGAITGKVSDSASAPLQSVVVDAIPSGGGFGWSGVTDSNGEYTIATNLAAGTYNVTAVNPTGHISKTISGVTVTADHTTTGVDLSLAKSGIISGRITASPSGTPLANTTIVASYGSYFGYATSNATGNYRIVSGLGTATYTVIASYSYKGNTGYNFTTASVTAGSETPNVNMEISVTPPAASGIITGKVTDKSSGNPIEDASVDAQGTGGFGSAVTDANGNYVISNGLGTGTYNVTASAAGYNSTTTTGVSVTVSQTTPNINFQLTKIPPAQSGSISGTVTGGQNPVPEFATPILLFITIAAATIALAFFKKRTTTKTQ